MDRRNIAGAVVLLWLFGGGGGAEAQNSGPKLPEDPARLDHLAAELRVDRAEKALSEGRWEDALSVLERGLDFAGASSDLSFLLAKVRTHLGKPRGSVLDALSRAIAVDWWTRYTPSDGWLLAAEVLLQLRLYPAALDALAMVPPGAGAACQGLRILRGQGDADGFRAACAEALERYPRDTRPADIFLDFILEETNQNHFISPLVNPLESGGGGGGGSAGAGNRDQGGGRLPEGKELELLALVLRRLPSLAKDDPELAWKAAPFIASTGAARELVAAYRAGGYAGDPAGWKPSAASIPPSLYLGLIGEEEAITELFGPPEAAGEGEPGPILDKTFLEEVWAVLRHEEGRRLFRERLASYTGVISIDEDRDGIGETSIRYVRGMLSAYQYDRDQDGLADITINFAGGEPSDALIARLPEAAPPINIDKGGGAWLGGAFNLPRSGEERRVTLLRYETYPAVFDAREGETRYIPGVMSFFYAPVKFREFLGSGLIMPDRERLGGLVTRRTLTSAALIIERPSREFPGLLERVEMSGGIPWRAREYDGEKVVSETLFERGRPVTQAVDLDRDGRLETIRRFRKPFAAPSPSPSKSDSDPNALGGAGDGAGAGAGAGAEALLDYALDFEYAESDWDGDGIYEAGVD